MLIQAEFVFVILSQKSGLHLKFYFKSSSLYSDFHFFFVSSPIEELIKMSLGFYL